MWELDHKEDWAPKNWCFQIVVLEKTLESPLDCKEIKPVNPKGNQSWIFIGRTDAEAPILWPLDEKSWLIGKDPDAGKDWGQEKQVAEDDLSSSLAITQPFCKGDLGLPWPPEACHGACLVLTLLKPGLLQFIGSQILGHDLATEQTITN